MRTSKFLLLTYALFFVGGIFVSYILFGYFYQKTYFFEFRLVEAIQIISIYVVAIFVVRSVNTQLNNNVKKRELLANLIGNFQRKIADIYSFINVNALSLTKENRLKIRSDFRCASNVLNLLRETKRSKHCSNIFNLDDDIIEDFHTFKESITDWPQKSIKYDETRMALIGEKYGVLNTKIFNCKLNIYTK